MSYYPDPYRDDRIEIEQHTPPRFHAPEGQSWVFGAALGAGGFGRAYLWNLVSNADQKIIDRVVLKYTEIRLEQILSYGGLGHGEIREVFMQRNLVPNGTPPDKVFTVPLCWVLSIAPGLLTPGDFTHRLENVDDSIGYRQIPEPFAWYLLYRLVSAAVVMDTAFRTEQTHYQVVHCDFKPENIFLGAPGCLGKNNNFPAYPPAYLGDFGNAHITYPGDPNEHMMYGMCTVGWSAPEITKLGWVKEPWQAPGGTHTNIWQIGYIMLSVLKGTNQWDGDIDWLSSPYDYVPKYDPPAKRTKAQEAKNRLRRDYSPELLSILDAMVQFRVENRPSPQDVMEAIEENMPRHTQGMDRWGTNEWFEALDRSDVDASTFDASVDGSMISMVPEGAPLRGSKPQRGVDSLTDKFKKLFCFPRPRCRRRKTAITRALSPFSKERERAASRKRLQDTVTRQIREGLRPKFHRYVSPDPSDDIFVLDDDLKIIHPERPSTLIDYWGTPDPVPTTYREDIDDVIEYAIAKKQYERRYSDSEFPAVGVLKYNFRKDGAALGEVKFDPAA